MNRPPLEVADLIRAAGAGFIQRSRQWIGWKHVKVLLAIVRCRTAALGGHLDQCTRCGHRATISYNSCRNRHCPKCQTAARERWIAARRQQLLPTRYVHAVFTLPAELAPLVLQNKEGRLRSFVPRQCGNSSGSRPRSQISRRGNRLLQRTAHLEPETWPAPACPLCFIASGGLSPDGTALDQATPCFFLPVLVLSRVFRGKFVAGLQRAFPGRPTPLPRKSARGGPAEDIRGRAKTTVPKRLGGLRQTYALRRPGLCGLQYSGPLHAPRGYLQPSPGLVYRRPSSRSVGA